MFNAKSRHAASGAALATVLACISPAHAEPKKFTLDKGHAYIGFEIDHLGYSRTVGQFRDYDGTFLIDEQKPENSSITFTVKSGSIDTNHDGRDAHLRNADYLNVAQHPEMRFRSTSVTMLTPRSGKLHREFTLLGVTRPMSIDFKMVKDAPFPSYLPNYDGLRAIGFEATGEILRLEHGMNFVGFVGSPTGLVIDLKLNFDLVDCAGAKKTNVPCHYGR